MLAKRIIPCLDVKEGRVVKGVHFKGLRDAGDPVERAILYEQQGADEIVFLDIEASIAGRDTMAEMVTRTSASVFVPFTVGGGIRTVEDMGRILRGGADKVSINTSALSDPGLISRGARAFGSQCIVVAIDAKRSGTSWEVHSHGGRVSAHRDAVDWARQAVECGAGELLVTSIDQDGVQTGYDIALLANLTAWAPVPVIASGGAGSLDDFRTALTDGGADAALAASVFHDGKYTIGDVKSYLSAHQLPVRPVLQ